MAAVPAGIAPEDKAAELPVARVKALIPDKAERKAQVALQGKICVTPKPQPRVFWDRVEMAQAVAAVPVAAVAAEAATTAAAVEERLQET